MDLFSYNMPTKLFVGRNVVIDKSEIFSKYKMAFIVTGKNSAKKNGSLHDCIQALDKAKVDYIIFDEIEENPSIENVEKAADIGKTANVDFCIGIGGGSPLDAAKAIGVLIKNPNLSEEQLFSTSQLDSIPLIAIPTTAGTGSETTPYAILTIHQQQTKRSIPHRIFFEAALLDARYMLDMPKSITMNTAIDALTHLIESYLCTKSNYLSDKLCESGFIMFTELKTSLINFELDFYAREKLLLMSSLAGICIAQTGTSLPHGMGYALTYNKNIPHGIANGVLTAEYLKICNQSKVKDMLKLIDSNTIDDFKKLISSLIDTNIDITENELSEYTKDFMSNADKLKAHTSKITYDDILHIYKESLSI